MVKIHTDFNIIELLYKIYKSSNSLLKKVH